MAGRTFLGNLRLAALLAVLVFVALGAWLDRARSRDWDGTLRVTVYPLAADSSPETRRYVDALTEQDFDGIEAFLAAEARRYDLPLEEPVRVRVSHAATTLPPALAPRPGVLDAMLWSLRMRYYAARVAADDPLPTPDVQVFALYSPLREGAAALPDSAGLSKGLVAVAQLYAAREAAKPNLVVLTHELLHTLGAMDKYEPGTGLPRVPDGLGEPDRSPAYPQERGEIMAGRIAVGPNEAAVPGGLGDMVVGPSTAREIGWLK